MVRRGKSDIHFDRGLRDPGDRGPHYGGSLLAMAAGVGLPVVWHWWQTMQVPNPGYWILAGTLFMLGVETVFLSFLVGIIDLARESSRRG